MAKPDDSLKMRDDLFHLARVAMRGRSQDLPLLVRKLARRYKTTDSELSAQLTGLLRQTPIRGSPTRRAEVSGLPLDNDSRLPLVRLVETPDLDIEPVYDETTWGSLRQVVNEQCRLDRLSEAGIEPTRSVLFTGPPGVGKTFAAKWIARELARPLATLDLSAVMSSFLGRTGNNVRVVLDYAKAHDCVLLLDELDAVAKRRDDSTEIGELKRLVTVLLQEIDEWPASGLLLAATNHPDLLDPAVWRRFEMVINFPLPSRDHLAAVFSDLLESSDSSPWPAILGVALSGSSFSDAAQKVRRARRMAALNGGDVEHELEAIVKAAAESLGRDDKQDLALRLIRDAGVSQRQASEITGVSRDTIRKYEQKVGA
ncbi:MAG: AAA family ATPase [Phycisphaerales bacterium]